MALNTEIIERLYKEGSITFAEAMQLGLSSKDDNDKAEKEKNEEYYQYYLNKFIDDAIEDTTDENGDVLHGIDIRECYNIMHGMNWEMATKNGELDLVTLEMVRDNAAYVCKCAIEALIQKYKRFINGEVDASSLEACCATGGFQASAYIEDGEENEENPMVCLELEFIPKTSFACCEIKKLLTYGN